MFFVAMAILLGAAVVANPLHQVNAQANMTNGMNQTGAVGVLAQYGDQSGRQLVDFVGGLGLVLVLFPIFVE